MSPPLFNGDLSPRVQERFQGKAGMVLLVWWLGQIYPLVSKSAAYIIGSGVGTAAK